MKSFAVLCVIIAVIAGCQPGTDTSSRTDTVKTVVQPDTVRDTVLYVAPAKSAIELKMEALGLVDILSLDSTLIVDLRYSSINNFTGKDMYGELNRCYLQKDVALKLVDAQKKLRAQYPYYSLLVFDGARPVSIQQYMWDSVALPPGDRQKYLSNPANRSLHNYGAAVDLTIIDDDGRELDMGTPYDFFGELAHPRAEGEFFAAGQLTETQLANRELLRSVMRAAGFSPIDTEWWHFNSTSRAKAAEVYPVIE
jgi:zinc D-Ala-D-Ala dipeptidase